MLTPPAALWVKGSGTAVGTTLAALALLLTCAPAPAAAQAPASFTRGPTPWPELPAPPRARVQWVSDDMRVNGVPMRIQRFDSQASREEVVAFYVAHWKLPQQPEQPGRTVAAVTPRGPDVIVGRAHGPFYSVVKVRAAGSGSEGTMSTSQLLGTEPVLDAAGVPSPQGAQVVNVVEAIDNGKRNKQVLFVSRDSADSVAGYYLRTLRSAGWTLLQEQQAPAVQDSGRAIVRMFSRKDQQLDIAVGTDAANGVTVINANLVNF